MNSQRKTSGQLISCPICNEKIPYSTINEHLDKCTNSAANNKSSSKQPTLQNVLSGFKNRKRPQQDVVVDITDDDSVETVVLPGKPDNGDESVLTPEVSKRQKIEKVDTSSEYEFRRLQKISHLPLSEKLRPQEIRDYVGQQHILSQQNGTLYKYVKEGTIPSMILWGPPGVGKTSLARLLTKEATKNGTNYHLIETSATKANTQELRSIFDKAKKDFQLTKRRIVLFIDEIHRFNKAQQDLLLPHVENGDIILIGATTENPSFQLNNALISRCHIFVLEKLSSNEICIVLSRGIALLNKCRKLIWKVKIPLTLPRSVLEYIADVSVGDTRRAINILEMIEISTRQITTEITSDTVKEIVKSNSSKEGINTYYDTSGDNHYDTISALHKAIRGGDADSSLYYMTRMLQGGEDPLYIARRFIRIASEDVGLADNSLLPLAIAAHDAVMKIGLPEADMALAHCCVALAKAPKSVEVYRAYNQIKGMIKENKYSMASAEIPMHIRNAPTKLMQELGYHKGYKYNPDYKDGEVAQDYFPKEILDQCQDKKILKFLTGKPLGDRIDPDLIKNEEKS
ncbi:hypothetical protein Kpol_1014p42 [Vanderwaltozyma polyspora DSM 70294]|uniref:UBZ4-type domain-containing protein n=1 Tax=Vanderwaltozyma polyspora (strain ATCC 22028 / DSM 70294 / BCRC 21397 / CBS 2163 / NBRC 10782 / NRRL Y-8283 / UCD 57-17) TaxID=436907 RepID=A7TNG9_VANPO|nr:uncharacterized protein Kpol_1014p42 [Vanderwaltozyma polyspora DSM 70294]EDO16222.1 hypothetical protein Kpol_1014p42 [Vanderwaltozyma polyspora DSM 70294]